MKVKAIKDYNDLQLKRLVKTDEEITVSEARGKELISKGVVVKIVEENTEPTPKKKTAKKKDVE